MIYGHGDDTWRYGDAIKMNFSSNIYQKADLSELKAFLASRLDVIGHYPEPEPKELEGLIAEKLEIPANMVMVTNGANEAIYLIAQLYSGWTSIIPQPTYHEYADACKMFGHIISYERTDDLEVLPQDRIYWLCNPDNPTGNVILKALLAYVIRKNPRFLYVIDESYADYTLQPRLQPKEMMDCFNVMFIRSMSKKYCVPGLRLGYVAASPIIIDRLRAIRQPWTVNALAIEAGKYLVEHDPQLLPDMNAYIAEAQRLKAGLEAIDGLMVMDTQTHYMLVNIDWANVLELKNWLVEHHGILIRDASNFHGLDDHCFRVAAQTPEENDVLLNAIKAYQQEKQG
ncbi:MAG: aminotransferase class I/II-fold pyridoxal phosphate-dependent enzyme [Prevotella sp.]|nr:aminotransferase class I/II-fold pyridoxal phosphate-dependent enzyme [Prevotella sp.]